MLLFCCVCVRSRSKMYVIGLSLLQSRNGKGARIALNDSHNDSKDTKSRSKNLHNQNLDEKGRILRISNCTTGSSNTDRNTRSNVRQANRKSSGKHSVSSIVKSIEIPVFVQVVGCFIWFLNLVRQDNGHNNTVNSSSLAENDTGGISREV